MTQHPVSKAEALAQLRSYADASDAVYAHIEADEVLLDLICDPEIEAAWRAVPKWYA
jgi:hypothetical protein